MASATRLPLKSMGFALIIVFGAGASKTNLRALLTRTFTGPGKYSRIAAALVLLMNLKSLPFVWHFRVFNAIYTHCLFSLPNIPPAAAPSSLFLPVITSSRPSIWECDYNMHKSNSTYFSDLDITRCHLVCALFQPGIHKLNHNDKYKIVLDPTTGKPVNKRWAIMLGSVMCTFKREIGIMEPYEMWSKLLCWDRKWIYVVSHFVKKGAVKPSEYILTDGSWFGGKGYKKANGQGTAAADIDDKYIFASAISRYVSKKGRLTVHPEVLLEGSGLLPPRPGGWAKMAGPSGDSTPVEIIDAVTSNGTVARPLSGSGEWDWKRVEEENKRGLKVAEHFQALEGLHEEFTGSKAAALGKYRDLIW